MPGVTSGNNDGDTMRPMLLLPLSLLCMAAGEPPRPVRVVTVSLQPLPSHLVFSGTVQPRVQADLAFRVAGKVTERLVQTGDHVKAGQVLAKLDQGDLQLSQETAEAALQAALADASNAESDLARYKRLGHASSAYLPSQYDRRESADRMAAARVVQAARQVALARSQRSYSALASDADGIVTALPMQVGQVVAAGQVVATLAHTDAVEVVVDVPENRMAEAQAATDVGIALWADPGKTLHGKVREVGALADSASRTFTVKVAVQDAPPGLLSFGMTATVTFGQPGPPVAQLPATALTDRGGQPAVWVLDPALKRAKLRPVALAGYGGDGSLLVRSGLADGEEVVTAGVGQIEPDMAVTAWAGAAR